jgi:hypothetical protein
MYKCDCMLRSNSQIKIDIMMHMRARIYTLRSYIYMYVQISLCSTRAYVNANAWTCMFFVHICFIKVAISRSYICSLRFTAVLAVHAYEYAYACACHVYVYVYVYVYIMHMIMINVTGIF